MPLMHARLEHPGDGRCTVSLALGDRSGRHLTYNVREPIRIVHDRSDDGADEGMHIEAPSTITRLRFRVAATPESLDGMVTSG